MHIGKHPPRWVPAPDSRLFFIRNWLVCTRLWLVIVYTQAYVTPSLDYFLVVVYLRRNLGKLKLFFCNSEITLPSAIPFVYHKICVVIRFNFTGQVCYLTSLVCLSIFLFLLISFVLRQYHTCMQYIPLYHPSIAQIPPHRLHFDPRKCHSFTQHLTQIF